jgi:peroxiredoxin
MRIKRIIWTCVAIMGFNLFFGAPHLFAQNGMTTLQVEINGRQVDSLYLFRATADPRSEPIVIDAKENKARFSFKSNTTEAYQLIYPYQLRRGYWRPIRFFADDQTINMNLHPEQDSLNIIKGGEWTQQFYTFSTNFRDTYQPRFDKVYAQQGRLKEQGKFLNDSTKALERLIKETKSDDERDRLNKIYAQIRENNEHVTSQGLPLVLRIDSIAQALNEAKIAYTESQSTPVSYYVLYTLVESMDELSAEDQLRLRKAYSTHAQNFPDHPYTQLVGELLQANSNIKAGEPFVNFSAPNLQGEQVELADYIEGKVAILDLWASWCGPCIRKTRRIRPLYDKYKDKGLVMLGVAREFENTKNMERTIEREDYTWTNLVDLDDRNLVWLKYNIPYSGGAIILIDSDGTIMAVDPTVDEMRGLLAERFVD